MTHCRRCRESLGGSKRDRICSMGSRLHVTAQKMMSPAASGFPLPRVWRTTSIIRPAVMVQVSTPDRSPAPVHAVVQVSRWRGGVGPRLYRERCGDAPTMRGDDVDRRMFFGYGAWNAIPLCNLIATWTVHPRQFTVPCEFTEPIFGTRSWATPSGTVADACPISGRHSEPTISAFVEPVMAEAAEKKQRAPPVKDLSRHRTHDGKARKNGVNCSDGIGDG